VEDVRDVAVEEVGRILSAEHKVAEALELVDMIISQPLERFEVEEAAELLGLEP
jgi:hypothetical protein